MRDTFICPACNMQAVVGDPLSGAYICKNCSWKTPTADEGGPVALITRLMKDLKALESEFRELSECTTFEDTHNLLLNNLNDHSTRLYTSHLDKDSIDTDVPVTLVDHISKTSDALIKLKDLWNSIKDIKKS